MEHPTRAEPSATDPSSRALFAGAAVLALVAYLTAPALGHFAGALVPWPAHGIAAALIMAAPRARRAPVTAAVAFALVAGLLPLAVQAAPAGGPARLVAAVALVVGQGLVITLLYERIAGPVSPLASTYAYAAMLVAVVVGALPTTVVATLTLRLAGATADGYTGWGWWMAAASSGTTIIGIVFAFLHARHGEPRLTGMRRAEFVLVSLLYGVALLSAFAELGPFAGVMTPALAALPFLTWGGLRYGRRGFAFIALLLIIGVVLSTALGIGPFGRYDELPLLRLRRAWLYLASLVGPAMIFPVAIAERAEADRRTRAALAQLRALFEGAGDLIAAVDRDLRLIAANPAWRETFERLTGTRAEPGMRIEELHRGLGADGDLSLALWRRALGGESFTVERPFGLPSRARETFEVTYAPVRDERGEVVGASHVLRNVTERRRREAQAAEAQRLESLGRLAGGVAHDFNNLMTAVLGYADLLEGSLPAQDERRQDVVEIQRAAHRAAGLTQQLLAFARRREVQPQVVDVAALVAGMDRLLRTMLGVRIRFEVDAQPGAPRAYIDPAQLEQVLMNLAVNARDAMPDGGDFRLVVGPAVAGGAPAVELRVSDTGEGMSPDVQARIFEPFFTTKATGKGTGLGLSTVHGIVHQAGGRIDVESAPGHGTMFRITLPAAPDER